ncbi:MULTISPECIES: formate dehydrogenase accessory sulfurtransferase FdhD [Sphingomonas]|jgi:formate dehydrogenase accessory protein FdhD|uniref:formate dehydrogenase accessory sulfurtransferase FdhD n=2 Tax=Alphaproteobacteria TaxID=28211 RepID=UPI002FF08CED
MRALGAILAGGQSRRFGTDKALAEWNGAPLLAHCAAALSPQVDHVVLCGRVWDGLESVADRPEPGLGPLGALNAALHYAAVHGYDAVLTVPVDVHPLPTTLRRLLEGAGAAVLDRQTAIGWWPTSLAIRLDTHIATGARSLESWIALTDARRIDDTELGLVNINRPDDLAHLTAAVRDVPVLRVAYDDTPGAAIDRSVPVEAPIAIEYNGIGYAVMMGTPTDLADFVTGFTISEGLATLAELTEPSIVAVDGGWIVRAELPQRSTPRVLARARTRVSESGCGICGIDSIAAALAPLPPVTARISLPRAAVARALGELRNHQRLGRATGATHAAAFCSPAGDIVLAREDVGRHNALDKLIGALARHGISSATGFVLLSARCSQELVEKTVRAGFPMLITISAPTSLAIDRAREAGLALAVIARDDTMLIAHDPHRSFG